jgi:hypothetical protein
MSVALPKEKTKPSRDLTAKTTLLYGPPKIGKCLAGETLLIDPQSARPVRLDRTVANATGSVLTMGHGGIVYDRKPSAYLPNPEDRVFRVVTQTGREILATRNHPFLTREGWRELRELSPNDRVAVIAAYRGLFGGTTTDHALIKILAYLLADGSLGGGSSPIFTKDDDVVREDFLQAVEEAGCDFAEYQNAKGAIHVRVKARTGTENNVLRFIREVGVDGLKSAEKFIPEFVFGLKRERMALFLNRLFSCDGCAELKKISFSSTSIRMVRQVQHLLLRFGIVGIIRDKYREGELYGAEIYIAQKDDVLRFLDEIGFYGEKAVAAEKLRAHLFNVRSADTQLDRVGDILFDRIRSIEEVDTRAVYDLTVEHTHNYIANDFIVHNSSLASQFPGAVFLECEPGLNELEVFKIPTYSWDAFKEACKLLAEGDHDFRTIVVDTVDNCFRYCTDAVNAQNNVQYEGDLPHGKGWAFVKNEWHRVLTKLASLPYGLVLISHAQDKRIETRTGEYIKTQPSLPDRARAVVLGLVDMILYCDTETAKGEDGSLSVRRVIRTKPHPTYEAGDRTNRLPDVLPLSFEAFEAAFNGPTSKKKEQ